MANAITSPEPTQGEPHPAVRLAEAVCALIAAIAGPSWFWRFLPGGRAFWAQMHRMGQDFAALMHRLAAAPPQTAPTLEDPTLEAPIAALARRRQQTRSGAVRPRRASRPRPLRRASSAIARTRRPACVWPALHHTAIRRLKVRLSIALRKRRTRNPRWTASQLCAHIVTIRQ